MNKNLRMEEVGDELILWEDNPLQAHVLDRVHTRLYRLASEGRSLDAIEAGMRAKFQIPPDRVIKPMLIDMLLQLVKQGLIDETTLGLEQ